MNEVDAVKQRYARRDTAQTAALYPAFSAFQHFSRAEREYWYGTYLLRRFGARKDFTLLEVGAGTGDNIVAFRRFGLSPTQIFANELLPERTKRLGDWLPSSQILPGDALSLGEREFDVIFQSTVFSSLLDRGFKMKLAAHLWKLIRPGGGFLWYDFQVNNPNNPDVRGIPWTELQQLFPEAKDVWTRKVTLAPPLGRRVGRAYNWLNWPVFRTHRVAFFTK